MSSKQEKDRTKQIQDKCQTVLNELLRDDDNKYCVDCDNKGPLWASWNIGVFLCIRCAGLHRNLGVHISKVKSVNLDTWTPEQVVSLQQMGNSRARAVYEANLPDMFRRPQSDESLQSFIRAKYEHKKYIAREWVPQPLPKVNWEKEIDEEMAERQKKKKSKQGMTLGAGGSGSSSFQLEQQNRQKVATSKQQNVEIPQLPKPVKSSKTNNTSTTIPTSMSSKTSSMNNIKAISKQFKVNNVDLLGGLDNLKSGDDDDATNRNKQQTNDDDMFTNFLSAKKNTKQNDDDDEKNFFNQTCNNSSEQQTKKLTKDSIMALYNNQPMVQLPPPSTAQYIPYGVATATTPFQQAYHQSTQQIYPIYPAQPTIVSNPFFNSATSSLQQQPPAVIMQNQYLAQQFAALSVNTPTNLSATAPQTSPSPAPINWS